MASPDNSTKEDEFESSVTVIEKQVQKRIFKIIVIGDSNVGKTCLTYRFCSGKFPDKTEATIGVDFRERTVTVDNEEIKGSTLTPEIKETVGLLRHEMKESKLKLQLWDTAGQERFRKSMVQHYYRNVHAVVFVFDVTKVSSFENMPGWIEECDKHNLNKELPRILIGNKCDMVEKVAVNTNQAQKFADTHNMPLFETSAKDEEKANHVEAIFMTLAHKLKNAKPMMPVYLSQYGSAYARNNDVVNIHDSPERRGLQRAGSGDGHKDSCSC